MAKVNVIFYSMYGHIYQMAKAEAEGAKEVKGTDVKIYRVPETVPEDILIQSGAKKAQEQFLDIPIANLDSLVEADAIIFGTPTRFGMMAAQMRQFLDTTGPLWAKRSLVGKIGSVFTSTSSQHGGQESTILNFHTTLLHHGLIIVGIPFTEPDLSDASNVHGGSPYGASAIIVQGDENRPNEIELNIAKSQGRRVAEIAKKLFG
ncbi:MULTISPECIES: NAD(P)H:quinone oxidoreductase [Petrotoga]|uniref:NAD(P)H dehydrogenase (quinone) n=2 Tax=Petrotoga sibirica TaxID=156202 RepID=A0A4R8F2I7_9BACT|nr:MULTISPECIES: NAD(P)H:quinone oxidoreductase [Petrotoga]KUK83139.1 MAG: NAD(P)H dehydrogenase (quinone) [Petrotoga mobilis]POZ88798.1 NAD(P)H-quinone oxidoreductase [Petrotoga sibirica DSM 13575]POZ90916.1 NAD(P)H-quinone oxidoreductase [Petrotoga sp. SL27]TDX17415.1 NAD(P)H dehydrogenase (quinone) [Petrotoga sibirica]